jgi:hypothetical protein
MLPMLASTPWLQFNPLMDANKGLVGVNLAHIWDEIDRMTRRVDQRMSRGRRARLSPRPRSDVSL